MHDTVAHPVKCAWNTNDYGPFVPIGTVPMAYTVETLVDNVNI